MSGALGELAGEEKHVAETEGFGDLADREPRFGQELASAGEAGGDDELLRALAGDFFEGARKVIHAVAGGFGEGRDGAGGAGFFADFGDETLDDFAVVLVEAGGGPVGVAGGGFADQFAEESAKEGIGGGVGGRDGLGAQRQDAAHHGFDEIGVRRAENFVGRGEAAGGLGQSEVKEVHDQRGGRVVGGFVAPAGTHPQAYAGCKGDFTVGREHAPATGAHEPEIVVAQARGPIRAEVPVGFAANPVTMGGEQNAVGGWGSSHRAKADNYKKMADGFMANTI